MEAQEIIARIQSPQRLLVDDAAAWGTLSRRYPYFSLGRLMACAHAKFQGKKVQSDLNLHLHNPFHWAAFLKNLEANPAAEAVPEPKPVTEVLEVQDIVSAPTQADPIVESVSTSRQHTQSQDVADVEKLLQDNVLDMIDSLPETPAFELDREALEKAMSKAEDNKENKAASIVVSQVPTPDTVDRSLMVMMSFTDWLGHFKKRTESEKEEEKEQKALKTAWQKEKLAAAADEEIDEIPEPIFKQAMDSISQEGDLVSEALAQILTRQGKRDKAIAMYKKLSLRNPEKSAYFASLIAELN